MVEITLPIALQIIQTVSLVVGIIYYLTIMRNNQKTRELTLKAQEQALETRQAQLIMQIYGRWSESDYKKHFHQFQNRMEWTDIEDFMHKYTSTDDLDEFLSFSTVVSFYEGIGVLVKRDLIDKYIVDDLLGGDIIQSWEKVRSLVPEGRKRGYPTWLECFEHLYHEIKPIYENQIKEVSF
jgi:hypothetical protein